jgi:hypothetical protein
MVSFIFIGDLMKKSGLIIPDLNASRLRPDLTKRGGTEKP